MSEGKITSEDYKKAMETIVQYRLENQDFHAKITFAQSPESHVRTEYYDNLDNMVRDIWDAGATSIIIEESKQISKEEFEDNHLPF